MGRSFQRTYRRRLGDPLGSCQGRVSKASSATFSCLELEIGTRPFHDDYLIRHVHVAPLFSEPSEQAVDFRRIYA